MKPWKALICFSAILLLIGCNFLSSGGGTEGEGLSGQTVTPDGKPAANVLMRVFYADTTGDKDLNKNQDQASGKDDSNAAVDSVLTDSKGRFRFSNLKDGLYNVEGTQEKGDGNRVVLISGVHLKGNLDLGVDTLRASGTILIRAQSDGVPLEGTDCYVPGTSYIAISDDSGTCAITGVPPGIFQVRLRHEGLVSRTSGYLQVQSGVITNMGTLVLVADPDLEPPPPKQVFAQYDSLSGTVTVTWKRVQVVDLAGYVVYKREDIFSTPERLTNKVIQDSVYKDVLKTTDTSAHFLYQVRAQDYNGNLSLLSDPFEVKIR